MGTHVIGALLAAPTQDPSQVSPGIWGFIAFFALAIALWLLVRNMNTHLRKVSYRARQEADQERAVRESRPATQGDGASAEGAAGPEDRPNGPAERA